MYNYDVDQRNKKLRLEDCHFICDKICELDESDIILDISRLQQKVEEWSDYYQKYERVFLDSSHYDGRSEFYLAGIRLETDEEKEQRIKIYHDNLKAEQKKEEDKRIKERAKKIALLEQLKKELGE